MRTKNLSLPEKAFAGCPDFVSEIDWEKVPLYRAAEITGSLPEGMQTELNQFYEEELK